MLLLKTGCVIPDYGMPRDSLRLVLVLALAALTSAGSRAFACAAAGTQSGSAPASSQDTSAKRTPEQVAGQGAQAAKQGGAQANDPGAALDFLGSYSAPQAVLATETGHTSARPPSATSDQRLAELASDLGKVPVAPAELRSWLAGMLASGHSPEDWFRIGIAALQAARADSRRLTEAAPSSEWNQRLEAEALAGRYPALSRSVWDGKAPRSAQTSTNAAGPTGPQRVPLSESRGQLERLNRLPESPENLYARTRLLLGISEQAFVRAAASPQLDARLYALQALAAEDANDEGGALAEYQSGIAKYPDSALLHAGLGHLDRERNNLESARAQLEQSWRLDDTDPLVAFELGDVELRMGKPDDAIATLNRALALDPNLLVARWARGRAYLAAGGEGSDRRALEDLIAAESCDQSGVLEHQIAQLDSRLGRTAEAQEAERRSGEQRRAAAGTKGPAIPK